MRTILRTLAALFVVALVAAACSNGDGESTSAEDDGDASSTTATEGEGEVDDASAADDGAGDDGASDDGAADDGAADDGAADDGAADDSDDSTSDDGAVSADDDADMTDDGSADNDSDTGSDDGETGAGAGDDAAVDPNAGITVLGVSFSSGTVTLRNDSDATVDFAGFYLCNRPQYAEMPPETLEPGATLDLDVTDLDIRASAGEFGLFRSQSFDNAADMVAYVQWGRPDNGRSATAVEAGLIAEGEFVDNGGNDIVLE